MLSAHSVPKGAADRVPTVTGGRATQPTCLIGPSYPTNLPASRLVLMGRQ